MQVFQQLVNCFIAWYMLGKILFFTKENGTCSLKYKTVPNGRKTIMIISTFL